MESLKLRSLCHSRAESLFLGAFRNTRESLFLAAESGKFLQNADNWTFPLILIPCVATHLNLVPLFK